MKKLFLLCFLLSCVPETGESKPPRDNDGLHAWLASGEYKNWKREDRIKIGDNGAPRRLFVNHQLFEGLQSEITHQDGAIAIREMYEKDEVELRGISFMEKRKVDGKLKWFYYETFDLEEASHSVAEVDAAGCEFCHKDGDDYIQSTISYYEDRVNENE